MTEEEQLAAAVAALEAQRALLGDAIVEAALGPMRAKLKELRARVEIVEQRRQISVLFADMSGFTAMSETMDPEELRDLLEQIWTRIDGIITAHGGLIDKHIGDAVMALWGAKTLREDDPEQAVRAALEMQSELGRLRQSLRGASGIRMRIGVNTGIVWVGAVGANAEFTAMGDAVNVASRLEHAAEIGTVLISHDTYRHIRGMFDVNATEPLRVKGKTEPIQAYTVIRARTRAQQLRNRGIEGVETTLVGRAADLKRVKDDFRVAALGRLNGLIVVCDPGMGKSRLVTEFRQWLQADASNARLVVGLSTENGRRLPYGVIRDLFAFEFGILDTDSAEPARKKFEGGFVAALGGERDPDAPMKAHLFGHMLGFDFSASPYIRELLSDAAQIRDRAFQYFCDYFAAMTKSGTPQERPVVAILEDIHWADPGTLDAFEHVFEACAGLPLFFLCLTRGTLFEHRPRFGKAGWRHDMQPLSKDDTRVLIGQILGKVRELPNALLDMIVEGSEGIPFYVEELIKVLIDDKVIVPGDTEWTVATDRLAAAKVPSSLVGILQVRLDGLSPSERIILQKGSVLGRTFSDAMVTNLHGENDDPQSASEVVSGLQSLMQRELVYPRDPSGADGARDYKFKHALLRDVTYDSILLKHRRPLHAQVAEWIIVRNTDRIGEHAGLVAFHYEHAAMRREAANWYTRAGHHAQAASAPAAAIGFYDKAIALLEDETSPHQEQRLELFQGLGEVHWQQGSFPEAIVAYEKMNLCAQAVGDAVSEARAFNGLASAEQRRGNATRALEHAERAEQLARVSEPSIAHGQALVQALVQQGMAHTALGDLRKTQTLAEEALELTSHTGDRRGIANSLRLLGIAHDIQGRPQQAADCFARAKDFYQELGDQRMAAGMLNNLGVSAEMDGDHERAVACFTEALGLARDMGFRVGATQFLSNLGGGRIQLGQFAQAERDLKEAIHLVEARGSAVFLPETYGFLAEAYLGQGKLGEARDAAEKAVLLAREAKHSEFAAAALRALGSVMAESERVQGRKLEPAYETCFAESLAEFEKVGMDAARAHTLKRWAIALKPTEPARSLEKWQEARELFHRAGMARELERMDLVAPDPVPRRYSQPTGVG